jgi:hypothetical protein
MLTAPGKTDPDLRRNVEAYVVAQWGVDRAGTTPIPKNLEPYLKKLSLHAYRITDDDVQSLRANGYTGEEIYEITIVGAMAAGLVGLEGLLAALIPLAS